MILAQKHQADIIIANLEKTSERLLVSAGDTRPHFPEQEREWNIDVYANLSYEFIPVVNELDASSLTVAELADVINKEEVWMIARGYTVNPSPAAEIERFCSILSRITCPLLLLPDTGKLISFERIAYLTDLRYCQLRVVRFLAAFGAPFNSNVLLAHLAAKGLPDIEQNYAISLFKDSVWSAIRYRGLSFDNIKEKQTQKVMDVLVHGMQNELLALVHNHHHFDEAAGLLKGSADGKTEAIPFLFFPC